MMSPHCTHRLVVHSNSLVLFHRSIEISFTIRPPHLQQLDGRSVGERSD